MLIRSDKLGLLLQEIPRVSVGPSEEEDEEEPAG